MSQPVNNHSDTLATDVLIVGAGPAGLACAIHLARKNPKCRILVLEKSARIGGHLLSGAVMRPEALKRLLTPGEYAAIPLGPIVRNESYLALTPRQSFRLPFVPPKMRATGLPMPSLSNLGTALGQIAASLGVEILTAQTADSLLWKNDIVAGVRCENELVHAATTVLAEGPAGLLHRELTGRHPGRCGVNPQTHALGIKELIEIPARAADATGTIVHTFGYPLGWNLYGGGFLYHVDATHVALGLALAIDYKDSSTHPHELFRKWKRHPVVQSHIAGGKAVAYGSRLIPEGGWHSLSRFDAPGAMVIGDSAGLVDAMELKGLHLALESGMAAAEAILRGDSIRSKDIPSLEGLRLTPNYRAAFRGGLPMGMAAAGTAWLSHGLVPGGRIAQRNERTCLRPIGPQPPTAPAPDAGPIDLGMDSDLFLANLRVRNNPAHIQFKDAGKCKECRTVYAAPCTRFCPAAVYALAEAEPGIHTRAENCLQCRCCTLKCPFDNIRWETPRHGTGPDYRDL